MNDCTTIWAADCVEVLQYVEQIQGPPGRDGAGGALPWTQVSETFDGQFNRTLAQIPVGNSLLIYLNGVLIQRSEYTITGAQIAMVPSSYFVIGDQITYVYQF